MLHVSDVTPAKRLFASRADEGVSSAGLLGTPLGAQYHLRHSPVLQDVERTPRFAVFPPQSPDCPAHGFQRFISQRSFLLARQTSHY